MQKITVCRPPLLRPEQSTPAGLISPTADVITATAADVDFVVALQKKFTHELGFLPKGAIQWYAENARIRLAQENDDNAGYLLGRARFKWQPLMRPITQAAIAMDARRRHLGLSLVAAVVEEARLAGQVAVQAMCAADLESVEFWRAAGFSEIGRYSPTNTRARQMICFRNSLTAAPPPWFGIMPPVAGWKGRRVAVPQP